MTTTKAIDADVTTTIDQWAAAIGTPDHLAASEALDALLVDYCALRAASQRAAEVPEAESLLALVRLAAMDGYNPKPVSTVDEWVDEAKKWVFLVYLAGRNAVPMPTQRAPEVTDEDEVTEQMEYVGVMAFRARTAYWAPELFASPDHLAELVATIYNAMRGVSRMTPTGRRDGDRP